MTTATTSDCPTWERFISDAMGGDLKAVEKLRGILAEGLSGSSNGKIVILFSPTPSGKSTFLNAIGHAMGDLAVSADERVLTNPKLSELAEFEGKRFLFVEGDGVNLLTRKVVGPATGDKIRARRLGESYREFAPKYRLFLATNNLPDIEGDDEGIWRRVEVIRFHPLAGPMDQGLSRKLAAESEGIMAWIAGGIAE